MSNELSQSRSSLILTGGKLHRWCYIRIKIAMNISFDILKTLLSLKAKFASHGLSDILTLPFESVI